MFNNKIILKILFLVAVLGLLWGGTAVVTRAEDAVWHARYWNNNSLTGDPALVRNETELNFSWGNGSPAAGVIQNDNFSALWWRNVYFPAGNYRFTATMDDGLRVWVDGNLIIDAWSDSAVRSISRDLALTGGDHEIRVQYYEAYDQAVARLTWAPVGTIVNWKGEYFNNASLSGSPVLTRDDAVIDFDWGGGSPAWDVVASDQFSVRWTRTLVLQPGRYRFTATADDGVRLWINNQLLINEWRDSLAGSYVVEVDLPGGSANVKMEYYENIGGAIARLSWERIGGSIYNWRGEYFNNKTLSGTPTLVRDDAQINFNWGNGSPAQGTINADNFSVRWTRSFLFTAGRYRFTVTSDDGVRLWVNNQQLINAWNDHQPTTYNGEIELNGTVPVRVEYYESGGGARINLTWTLVSSTPTPTPTPANGTGTVQSARLNVRTGPSIDYGVLTQLTRGQTVELAGYRSQNGNWVMIRWNNGTAWVSALPAYLATTVSVSTLPVWTGTTTDPGPTSGPTGQVINCYYLNVRSGPGSTYGIIKTVPAGTVVSLLGRNSGSTWVKARLSDGSTGWMSANYLLKSVSMSSLSVVN